MNLHFFYCETCGKLITVLADSGVPTICCGHPMKALTANLTDGAAEKHVPVYRTDGGRILVRVGSEPHPMLVAHSILWIGLRTAQGFLFQALRPGDRPEACFALCEGEKAEAVYAYCNLHGLWCAEVR